MQISREKIQELCRAKGLNLAQLLKKGKVSKTAYYSLLRKDSVLPKSILSIAKELQAQPSAFLEEENPHLAKIKKLQEELDSILQKYPRANRENVWHTLLLLQQKPEERLNRGLTRAQKFNFYR